MIIFQRFLDFSTLIFVILSCYGVVYLVEKFIIWYKSLKENNSKKILFIVFFINLSFFDYLFVQVQYFLLDSLFLLMVVPYLNPSEITKFAKANPATFAVTAVAIYGIHKFSPIPYETVIDRVQQPDGVTTEKITHRPAQKSFFSKSK